MTPSFIGLIATMLPGVRPSMSFASLPTASTRPFTLLIATIDGSLTTIPLPRAYTHVFAVPRSIARSLENSESIERRLNSLPRSRQSAVAGHDGPCRSPAVCCCAAGRGVHRCEARRNGRRPPTTCLSIGWSGGGLNTVFARVFDLIHGLVGGLDQLLGRCRHVGQCRHADRGREVNIEIVRGQEPECRDLLANARADRKGALAPGFRQHQRE